MQRIDRNKSFNGPEHLRDYEGFLTWSNPDAEGKNCTSRDGEIHNLVNCLVLITFLAIELIGRRRRE